MIKFMVANNNLSVFEGCPLPYPFGEYDGTSNSKSDNRSLVVMAGQNDDERLIETDEKSGVKSINSADFALLDSGFDL